MVRCGTTRNLRKANSARCPGVRQGREGVREGEGKMNPSVHPSIYEEGEGEGEKGGGGQTEV